MKFIVGYKTEMTQKYRDDGTIVPVTIVKADPIVVTQIKTKEKDGYNAVQFGIGTKKKYGKSLSGHVKKILATSRKPFAELKEFRVEDTEKFKIGDLISNQNFTQGDIITVTGKSKGKGFQGVVKRHGFSGSPASHGHKDQLRMPGSIGCQDPQHVFKGTRMGGRTGGNQITVKNLEIFGIDKENNLIFVKGALPGARNSMVVIQGKGQVDINGNIFENKITKADIDETVKNTANSNNEQQESLPAEDGSNIKEEKTNEKQTEENIKDERKDDVEKKENNQQKENDYHKQEDNKEQVNEETSN